MYDDVLIPTDGSATVDQTLAHALPIAEANDATVHALSIVDTRIVQAATGETRAEIEAKLERESEAAVDEVGDRAAEAGLETIEVVEYGTPSKAILEYADEHGIDLIVIGTHGKSPREKQITMGSVSERVVDKASIPVFVVRSPGDPVE
ncbi:universal stress protein [Natronobeatus ordinarius]|uniref:universal stress protein n=1 Tax=Natronobeatus ordinarius TaxID=2963433 RepID=UPI0020CBCC8B|nr:universal stress protein [Natronobeatus ordinarius]